MFKRVIVGISGGVDSAVAAHLLKERGYDVVGVFMRNWDVVDEKAQCPGEQEWEHAQMTCARLNIPLVQKSFVKHYWNNVFQQFIEDYEKGLTPNPDVLCNKFIKFNHFYKFAREQLSADAIATGHYANSSFGPYLAGFDAATNAKLLKPTDSFKDQTFFLSQISQTALNRTMFPLAGELKVDVKRLASQLGLDFLARKKESTGICFIGNRHFPDFISEYVADRPGPFVDIDTGHVIGQHRGLHHWTVGQGCRLGGQLKAYFVAEKDLKANTIFVASGTDHPSLFSSQLTTETPHWIDREPGDLLTKGSVRAEFRFQHTKPLVNCVVRNNVDQSGLLITLEKPLRAITPGQYAVLYQGVECLGSARIISRELKHKIAQICPAVEPNRKLASS